VSAGSAARRVLAPVAALALAASAAAGCKPPVEKSEYINSGTSVALAGDPSKAPAVPANPPPNIAVPAPQAAAAQPPSQ